MENYLKETELLNFNHPSITNLIGEKNWNYLNDVDKVKSIYNYVRDEIKFGYNASDSIKASNVLSDGYGQCNTKATLLMTLLRAVGIRIVYMVSLLIKNYKKVLSMASGINYHLKIFYIVG